MKTHATRFAQILFSAGIAAAVVAGTANLAAAQELGSPGESVEVTWGGKATIGRVESCSSTACYLYLYDGVSGRWSDGTAFFPQKEIRGLKGSVNAKVAAPAAQQALTKRATNPATTSPARTAPTTRGAMYKVGDRIESHVTGNWQPGTVINVQRGGDGQWNYLINNDGEAHTWDRWASLSQVRVSTGLVSPTMLARNELAALTALKAPKAGSLDEIFQNLIRESYELQGSKNFPVTVTFLGFAIGQTHLYARPSDYGESIDGPGGIASTIVYPVSVQFYHRHASSDAFLTYQQDEVYKCFKNGFGKWQCNPSSGGKGLVKKFREERADFGAPK